MLHNIDQGRRWEAALSGLVQPTLRVSASMGLRWCNAAPELRMIGIDRQTLVLQLYDPQPAPAGASWVQAITSKSGPAKTAPVSTIAPKRPPPPRLASIWTARSTPDWQACAPVVKHSKTIDESGRPVHLFELRWPDDDALTAGVAVVYSQADHGRQSYVFATTGIVRNRPLYLPAFSELR